MHTLLAKVQTGDGFATKPIIAFRETSANSNVVVVAVMNHFSRIDLKMPVESFVALCQKASEPLDLTDEGIPYLEAQAADRTFKNIYRPHEGNGLGMFARTESADGRKNFNLMQSWGTARGTGQENRTEIYYQTFPGAQSDTVSVAVIDMPYEAVNTCLIEARNEGIMPVLSQKWFKQMHAAYNGAASLLPTFLALDAG